MKVASLHICLIFCFKKKYKKVYGEKIYRIHNLGEISWWEDLVGYEETKQRGRMHSPLEDAFYNTHTHTHTHTCRNKHTHTSSPAEPQPGHCSQFKKEASHLVRKFSHTNTLGKK